MQNYDMSSVFHDLGPTPDYSSPDLRVKWTERTLPGNFWKGMVYQKNQLQFVWGTIAVHTTIGIAEQKEI